MNGYAIYITDQTSGTQIELPVNPAQVELSYETDDKSETVINLGEVNTVGHLKLTSLTIESFFPEFDGHYVSTDDLQSPEDYIEDIKDIQEEQHKVQ